MADAVESSRESVVVHVAERTVTRHELRGGEGAAGARPGGKYSVQATVGSGGMGEVLLVRDDDLRREIAMKVLRGEAVADPECRMKFIAEAQATSQLEHPGIPPVHDLGLTPDGVPYFTMKLVRGQSLRDVLHSLLIGRREFRRAFTLHRLLSILERICETLHFAHEKGVLHRDLKPENVMLGDYGEVHVMDWGIARVRGEPVDTEDEIGTVGTDADLRTVDGCIKGTAPYMSPEQASGRISEMDRRSDVWALGCVLYEILTLHRCFTGSGILEKIRRAEFVPVRSRNPHREVPEDLAVLCDRCLQRDPRKRPASARAVAEALRSWLDGSADRERRHREAERLTERAREAVARHSERRGKLAIAERRADTVAAKYSPWQTVQECLPMLLAREQAIRMRRSTTRAFAEATRLLEGALLAEEDHGPARTILADLWRGRLADAEEKGDEEEAEVALEMTARYDDGRLAEVIDGHGVLELTSDPEGAEVVLHRLEDRHGILHEEDGRVLGRTPLGPQPLPMGSYVCVLRAPGFRDTRYPVYLRRDGRWCGHVRMLREEEIGPGFIHVPAGPFLFGEGDGTEMRELHDFAITEAPVTFGDWAGFLEAVERERGEEAAAALVPGTPADGPYMERTGDGRYRCLPNNVEGEARERCVREHGEDFERLLPVSGVSWFDAEEFCRWRRSVTGGSWRLPTEEEREKAARGVDGRRFPWGDLEHASLAKCRDSRDEMPQPEPVGTFPSACSVYGMRDAAGNSWDWTDSWYDEGRTARVLRGGGWLNPPSNLRCAAREGLDPRLRDSAGGFRCARTPR